MHRIHNIKPYMQYTAMGLFMFNNIYINNPIVKFSEYLFSHLLPYFWCFQFPYVLHCVTFTLGKSSIYTLYTGKNKRKKVIYKISLRNFFFVDWYPVYITFIWLVKSHIQDHVSNESEKENVRGNNSVIYHALVPSALNVMKKYISDANEGETVLIFFELEKEI